MERNVILENLDKITDIKENLHKSLSEIVDKTEQVFYQDENVTAKILDGKTNRYLLVKRPEGVSVYSESKEFKTTPFSYANVKDNKIYYSVIFKVPNVEYFQTKTKEKMEKLYKELPPELLNRFLKIEKSSMRRDTNLEVTNSLFGLEEFFTVTGVPESIKKEASKNNGKLDFLINDPELKDLDVGIISYNIGRLYDGAVSNKFNIKNKGYSE